MNLKIKITDRAALLIKDILEAQDVKNGYLEIRVVGGGCSGLQYEMGITEIAELGLDEISICNQGINILVDKASIKYLDGSEVDYIENGLNTGFKITNPNATKTCGCSASFSTDENELDGLNQGQGCQACKS